MGLRRVFVRRFTRDGEWKFYIGWNRFATSGLTTFTQNAGPSRLGLRPGLTRRDGLYLGAPERRVSQFLPSMATLALMARVTRVATRNIISIGDAMRRSQPAHTEDEAFRVQNRRLWQIAINSLPRWCHVLVTALATLYR